jgi:hypothetical protein
VGEIETHCSREVRISKVGKFTNKKLEFLKPKWQSVILEKHLLIVNNTVEKIEREFLRKEEEVRKYNQK